MASAHNPRNATMTRQKCFHVKSACAGVGVLSSMMGRAEALGCIAVAPADRELLGRITATEIPD